MFFLKAGQNGMPASKECACAANPYFCTRGVDLISPRSHKKFMASRLGGPGPADLVVRDFCTELSARILYHSQ